jgi:uncharacterized protein (DUF1810 family)
MSTPDTSLPDDPFALSRFTQAQDRIYHDVLSELWGGQKITHWMWFVFPQMCGLGHSATARYYGIRSPEEAQRYLEHPILGPRLLQCAEAVLAIQGRTAAEIFGYPDDLKLRSSMTLFERVAGPGSVFARVLDKYFHGERDEQTLSLFHTRRPQETA